MLNQRTQVRLKGIVGPEPGRRGTFSMIILVVMTVLAGQLGTVYAQEPSALTDKTTCLVKYSTLSAMLCDKKNDGLVADVKVALSPSASPSPTNSPASKEAELKNDETEDDLKDNPIREMKGIKKAYIYTDRITKDKTGYYTKMRKEADVKSDKADILRPGDKVRVMESKIVTDKKEKTKTEWLYVQIFKSDKSELEGKNGWIERWIVDDINVPVEPTPTPSPTSVPSVKGSSDSNGGGNTSTSGEGEALFNKINEYRSSNGLPKFEKSERLCAIARERAPEVPGEVASGTVHSGFHRRGLGYPVAVENEVGYGNVDANFNWWINSSLHRASILGPGLHYSCLECTNGMCVQEFSPNP
jgi:hypothetical protein